METPKGDYEANFVEEFEIEKSAKLEYIFEFLGMYLFTTMSLANVAIYVMYPAARLTWTSVAFSWGINLVFGLYLSSFKSIAHLNPVLTLSIYLFEDKLLFSDMVIFSAVQYLAAFFASITVYFVYYKNFNNNFGILTTFKNGSIGNFNAFVTEFIGTMLLIGGICCICKKVTKNQKYIPIYVGTWLFALILTFGYQTSFAWNPARDLGPRVFCFMYNYESYDNYWLIPFIADHMGGVLGYLVGKKMCEV